MTSFLVHYHYFKLFSLFRVTVENCCSSSLEPITVRSSVLWKIKNLRKRGPPIVSEKHLPSFTPRFAVFAVILKNNNYLDVNMAMITLPMQILP